MMRFVGTVLIMRALKRLRHIVMKRFEIMEKFYSSKTLLKMAGGGDAYAAYPTSHPGSAPGCIITKDVIKFKRYVLN